MMQKLNAEQKIQMDRLRNEYKEQGRLLTAMHKDVASDKFSEVFADMPTDKGGLEQRLRKLTDFMAHWSGIPATFPDDTALVKVHVAGCGNMMSSYISSALYMLNEASVEAREEKVERLTQTMNTLTWVIAGFTLLNLLVVAFSILSSLFHWIK